MSKKFIFSAVALMAFSFAGMANEEVKEMSLLEENCSATYVAEKTCWIAEGKTEKEATILARKAYYECRNRNYNERQQQKIDAFNAL